MLYRLNTTEISYSLNNTVMLRSLNKIEMSYSLSRTEMPYMMWTVITKKTIAAFAANRISVTFQNLLHMATTNCRQIIGVFDSA